MERKNRHALGVCLGTFEGFNFREQSAIDRTLTVDEVIGWNHDADGEAEFWPAGDCPALSNLFSGRSSVSCSELRRLGELVEEVGGDLDDALLRLHFLVNVQGADWDALSASDIEEVDVQIYRGASFYDVRKDAAYELFELYWPELYALWEKTPLDGLRFDPDAFLDSPMWQTEEVDLGDTKALLVAAYG